MELQDSIKYRLDSMTNQLSTAISIRRACGSLRGIPEVSQSKIVTTDMVNECTSKKRASLSEKKVL